MLKLTVTIVATQLTFLMDIGHSHNNRYSNAKGLGNSLIITATRNMTENFTLLLHYPVFDDFQTFIQCFQIS
jgi:hypothetical protein